jgi:hypothetical protein
LYTAGALVAAKALLKKYAGASLGGHAPCQLQYLGKAHAYENQHACVTVQLEGPRGKQRTLAVHDNLRDGMCGLVAF